MELFREYEALNPDAVWIKNYREACERVSSIRAGQTQLTLEIARHLWTDHDIGVTTISRALLRKEFFDSHQQDMLDITRGIIEAPTPETLDAVLAQWKAWKEAGDIGWVPWASSDRVFAAADPSRYSSCVDSRAMDSVFSYLHNIHGLQISRSGNWATQNLNVIQSIRAEGLQEVDPITLNTFLWWITQQYIKENEKSKVQVSTTQTIDISQSQPFNLLALNTIFYGPPGTGKTYHIGRLKDELFTTRGNQINKEQLEEEIFGSLAWWEVAAAALHDMGGEAKVPDLKNHPFISAKSRTSSNKHLISTLWLNLNTHTAPNSNTVKLAPSKRREPFIFDKTRIENESEWKLMHGWEDYCPNVTELIDRYKNGTPQENVIKRYEFITFHQSYSYEEFVEGIRPSLADEEAQGELGYELVDGVFKKLCIRARNNPTERYALFIDEINRGNISKIFGELITLMEESKRENGKEPLMVRLPYSQEQFSVPSNLHVIGTMNTADRSLALLDTALRRRFSFEEFMPDISLLEDVKVSEGGLKLNVAKLLDAMNRRIELLYDREHTIGHAFFMGADWETPTINSLCLTFSRKIIPLLQEYFFEDWDKIRLILGDNQKEQTDPGLAFIRRIEVQEANIFGNCDLNVSELVKYEFNKRALEDIRSYIGVYDPSIIGGHEAEGQD
jgi:5-methylcytosine-specific restriction protein B